MSTQKAVSALTDPQSSGFSWGMIFSENRFPSRIKSGTGIFGIMPYDPAIAPVAELVDAPDSKSGSSNTVGVRFPSRAQAGESRFFLCMYARHLNLSHIIRYNHTCPENKINVMKKYRMTDKYFSKSTMKGYPEFPGKYHLGLTIASAGDDF